MGSPADGKRGSPWLCPKRTRNFSWPEELHRVVSKISLNHKIAFVFVPNNWFFSSYYNSKPAHEGHFRPWWGTDAPQKVAVLWYANQLDPSAILSWRCGLIEAEGIAYKFIFLVQKPADADLDEWLFEQLGSWVLFPAIKEAKGMRTGEYIADLCRVRSVKRFVEYDPSFLTISPFGRMGEVLDQLDECKRIFRTVIGGDVFTRRISIHEILERVLAFDAKNKDSSPSKLQKAAGELKEIIGTKFAKVDRNRLPKVLILGSSGVGKTLIARYLAWATSPKPGMEPSRPFKRVPCPEYLQRESDFEYDVFGYCAGTFTGGHSDGKKGFLLERMGGVVFFDEIGDASLAIQAKLLAYLDDYQVTPRGWSGDSMFCPMLVVAATNRPIKKWLEEGEKDDHNRRFRNDLFRRFNYVIDVPSLNERKQQELPYILDVMLQMEAFNPGGRIEEIGKEALQALLEFDYDRGNFRDLENMLRRACRKASSEGRKYIVKNDVIS